MIVAEIQKQLDALGDPATAVILRRFFKTGPGEYGEGDLFRGIRVPMLRTLSKTYDHLTLPETGKLLESPFHEDRLLSLFILIRLFSGGDVASRDEIYRFYLKNTRFINNWDLVDSSAEHIVGAFLWDKKRTPLYELALSQNLWERRIAILATFHFVKRGWFTDTLNVAKSLLSDGEDLIHKAVGWMLREVGKRDLESETSFLKAHYREMPRIMLRYAIEKFPEAERQLYLKGGI